MSRKQKSAGRRAAQVPGQFYGYSIQVTRMLAHLLRCHAGQAVSLEVLDDVAVVGSGGTTAEQTKSGLAHNPIADRSVDLWKTFFNWVEAIRVGALASNTRFVLYVAQPHEGSLVRQLDNVRSRPDAVALVQRLREEIWGKAPHYVKRKQIPESLAPFINGVLNATDDVLACLFAGFELEMGSGSPGDDLRPAIREKAISEAAVDNVLYYLLGWVKKTVDKLIEEHRSAVITWEEFDKKLVAAAKRFDRSVSLSPTPINITEADVTCELRNRIYVRQLQLIDMKERDFVQAVNDYLRASADRTSWSERGDVLEPSFEDFSDKLQRHWTNRKRLVEVEMPGRAEVDLGQALHANCMNLQIQLEGKEVPSYFTPGSYHAIADSLKIGWHPNFEARLGATPAGADDNAFSNGAENRREAP